jgi:hypothetical protein
MKDTTPSYARTLGLTAALIQTSLALEDSGTSREKVEYKITNQLCVQSAYIIEVGQHIHALSPVA